MDFLTVILIIAIALRVVLDLASVKANSMVFEWVYVLLFCGIGVLLLFQNHKDIWGYLSIALGVIWAARAISRSQRKGVGARPLHSNSMVDTINDKGSE